MKSLAKMALAAFIVATPAMAADQEPQNYNWDGIFDGTVKLAEPFVFKGVTTRFHNAYEARALVEQEKGEADRFLTDPQSPILNAPVANGLPARYQGKSCYTVELESTTSSDLLKGSYEIDTNPGTPDEVKQPYDRPLLTILFYNVTKVPAQDVNGTLVPDENHVAYEPDLAKAVETFRSKNFDKIDEPSDSMYGVVLAGCTTDLAKAKEAALAVNRASVERHKERLDAMLGAYLRSQRPR